MPLKKRAPSQGPFVQEVEDLRLPSPKGGIFRQPRTVHSQSATPGCYK